jgi:adenylate kinase
MKEKIKKLSERGEDLILSGSPRTVYEAQQEISLLKELYGAESIKVFFVKISAEETIFRNSHRKICELMRHPILYNKETETLTTCPLDGSKLIRREGLDDPEIIKTRLKEYEEKTFPMMDVFKAEGVKVTEINGEQSVSDVFGDILKAL